MTALLDRLMSFCSSYWARTREVSGDVRTAVRGREGRVLAGVVPRPIVNSTSWIQRQCSTEATGHDLYVRQDLFSVYVHRKKGAPPSPADSIFASRDINNRCGRTIASRGQNRSR